MNSYYLTSSKNRREWTAADWDTQDAVDAARQDEERLRNKPYTPSPRLPLLAAGEFVIPYPKDME